MLVQVNDVIEWVSVIVFTVEYLGRLCTVAEERQYRGCAGTLRYLLSFFALIDLASIAPFYVEKILRAANPSVDLPATTFLRVLRLLRLLKAGQYYDALARYSTVISKSLPVLKLTLMVAMVTWVFFSILMYYAERESPDPEIRANYATVPAAMWMTLLNLSGEAPLCKYRFLGRVVTGVIGLFATAFFAIPIAVLSGGFENDYGLDDDEEEEEGGDGDGDDEEEEKPARGCFCGGAPRGTFSARALRFLFTCLARVFSPAAGRAGL